MKIPYRVRHVCCLGLIPLFLFLLPSAHAGSATWNANPTSSDWNTGVNWTPATVPMEPGDVATFGVSNITKITSSNHVEIDSMVFNPGASLYTIGPSPHQVMVLSGAGVINNSGITQRLLVANSSLLAFFGSASAGSNLTVNVPGTVNSSLDGLWGHLQFSENASAGSGVYTLRGGEIDNGAGGLVEFFDNTTAADSTFTLKGGTIPGARGAAMELSGNASLGNAMVTAHGGVAGSQETFIEVGGDATAANARLRLFGNGNLYIGGHNRPGFTVGSLEGDGGVFLGFADQRRGRTLIVGSNNLSTIFSGVIDDMGATGSLTKVGRGSLTLSGANTYLGATLVQQGQLLISNTTASGTGSGLVQVAGGARLGGIGTIAGTVTVGRGTGRGAAIAPGARGDGIGTLTIQSSLLCKSDATYDFDLDTDAAVADQLVANGVTIESGATFSPTGVGTGTLAQGTVFTAINNTSATPISGAFANLPDGGIVSVNGNNLQASYEGGDGNDLTLTVVP